MLYLRQPHQLTISKSSRFCIASFFPHSCPTLFAQVHISFRHPAIREEGGGRRALAAVVAGGEGAAHDPHKVGDKKEVEAGPARRACLLGSFCLCVLGSRYKEWWIAASEPGDPDGAATWCR